MKDLKYLTFFISLIFLVNFISGTNIITEDTIDTINITATNITANNFFGQWNGSFEYLLASQWNATNTSYMEGSNFTIQNESMKNYVLYVNSTNGGGSGSYDDSWINDTVNSKITANNNSVVNWVNDVFATILSLSDYVKNADLLSLVGNWSADKSSYTPLTTLNNGSYFNIAETDSLAYNGTLVDYYTLNNGTYSVVDTDTFVANYSDFLNKIEWSHIINGTLWSQIGNGTMFKTSQWNATNTSYLPLIGGSMTGNLNLSANVNLTMNGGNQILSNVTCIQIKGSTGSLWVC